jgi:hypothetical protein
MIRAAVMFLFQRRVHSSWRTTLRHHHICRFGAEDLFVELDCFEAPIGAAS